MLMRLGHKALKSTAKTNGQHATRIFYLSFYSMFSLSTGNTIGERETEKT